MTPRFYFPSFPITFDGKSVMGNNYQRNQMHGFPITISHHFGHDGKYSSIKSDIWISHHDTPLKGGIPVRGNTPDGKSN